MVKQLHANRGSMSDTQQLEVDMAGNNKWGSFPWLQYEQMILSIYCYRQNTLLPCISANACYDSLTCHCNELVTNSETWNIPVYISVNLLVFLSY